MDYETQRLIFLLVEHINKNGVTIEEVRSEIEKLCQSKERTFRDKVIEFVNYQMYNVAKKISYESRRLKYIIEVICIFEEMMKDTPEDQSIDLNSLQIKLMQKFDIKESTAKSAIALSRSRLLDYINRHPETFMIEIDKKSSAEKVFTFVVMHITKM